MEKIKRTFEVKAKTMITVIILMVVLIAGFAGGLKYCKTFKHDNTEISQTIIEGRLKECSELATCRMDYRGLITYEEGDIRFLTKKGFIMEYKAYIKAGIDLGKADINVTGSKVIINLPKAKLMDTVIDEDSLEFYDEKLALFNWEEKEDLAKAVAYAKEDAEKKGAEAESGILETAEKRAVEVVTAMVSPIVENTEGYRLEVNIK